MQQTFLAWTTKIGEFDGYVFVTPEYNHSAPGVLNNAIDFAYAECDTQAAAFVSYGTVGGVRAVEHLRTIASALQLAHVEQQLCFSLLTDFERLSLFNPAHTTTARPPGCSSRWRHGRRP
ncbi:NADPH-dependent FMN reductase [Streptomyces vietnamensis]|uniref:NADPH-dependent FMN reductase n=1 Tax=Streptomyces vietnamensis TaxID=362257 RepID=UPI00069882A7|nr:NADPH-dependent FMN reductase [Streptomyces vietnamensis]